MDSRFQFAHPEALWFCLLAIPALIAFFWWSWRKRRLLISQFVQSRLLAALTVGISAQRQKIRLALLVASVAMILFVLARPQWGFDWEEARQRGLDIVVAIDTSRSMLADDLKPNRLERAKLAAMDLRHLARNDRLGLVAFAGSAFLQCPLTLDDEPFRLSVDALNTTIIPQGGTALAEAIRCAQSAFKEKSDNFKVLVLFTDGEDHDSQALDAARAAAKDSLRIFTIGIGTASGELLRETDEKGRVDFIKDENGNVVKSRLNESLLEQIARAGQGFYRRLAGADTVDLLYDRGLAPLPKAEFATKRVKRWHERYQWFLGLSLVMLLVEMFLPERRRVRRSAKILAGGTNEELRKAVVLLLTLSVPLLAQASPGKARKAYDHKHYTTALLEYEDLLADHPKDPRLNYNAGAAAYQAEEYESALGYFQNALTSPDAAFQQRVYYNLGNTRYRLGEAKSDFDSKESLWQEAATNYQSALQLNPKDDDANFNLQWVKQKLQAIKKLRELLRQTKSKADDAVRRHEYERALALMQSLQRQPLNQKKFEDYVQRLQEIYGIATSTHP